MEIIAPKAKFTAEENASYFCFSNFCSEPRTAIPVFELQNHAAKDECKLNEASAHPPGLINQGTYLVSTQCSRDVARFK